MALKRRIATKTRLISTGIRSKYDKGKSSCYGEAIGLIDKEREDYPELSKKIDYFG